MVKFTIKYSRAKNRKILAGMILGTKDPEKNCFYKIAACPSGCAFYIVEKCNKLDID